MNNRLGDTEECITVKQKLETKEYKIITKKKLTIPQGKKLK